MADRCVCVCAVGLRGRRDRAKHKQSGRTLAGASRDQLRLKRREAKDEASAGGGLDNQRSYRLYSAQNFLFLLCSLHSVHYARPSRVLTLEFASRVSLLIVMRAQTLTKSTAPLRARAWRSSSSASPISLPPIQLISSRAADQMLERWSTGGGV